MAADFPFSPSVSEARVRRFDKEVRMSLPSAAHERLVIIGSGPAGYTAAIYAARAMVEPLLLSGFEPGGQLMITTDVENYPGFATPIQGPWLMDQMRAQAEHVGARIESEYVTALDLGQRPFRIQCDSGRALTADAIILATGAKAKWLGLPSEEAFKGFGVSACATCDGFFFRGKKVLVVGGGNSAVEEALYLSNIAAEVTVVHRRNSFRAEKILCERLAARPNVAVKWNRAIDEILGRRDPPEVTGARLRDTRTGASEEIAAEGIFVAIGHAPASELVRGQLALKPNGYVLTSPGLDRDQRRRRFRRRRHRRRCLSPGRHRRRPRLHGGARGRTVARRAGARAQGGGVIGRKTCYTKSRTGEFAVAHPASRSPRSKPAMAMAGCAGEEAMDWDKLRIFQAAADAGSFTHAGETLG